MEGCIFCRIIKGEISSQKVYEDDRVLAFRDINPQAPVHIVIVLKEHLATLNDVEDYSLYGDVFKAIKKIALDNGLSEKGYRVVANCKEDAGQTVFHVHFHLLGGRVFKWPPG